MERKRGREKQRKRGREEERRGRDIRLEDITGSGDALISVAEFRELNNKRPPSEKALLPPPPTHPPTRRKRQLEEERKSGREDERNKINGKDEEKVCEVAAGDGQDVTVLSGVNEEWGSDSLPTSLT